MERIALVAATENVGRLTFKGFSRNPFTSLRKFTASKRHGDTEGDHRQVAALDEEADELELVAEAAQAPGSPRDAITMGDFAELLDQLRKYKQLRRTLSEITGIPSTTMHEAIVKRRHPGAELTKKVIQLCITNPSEQREWELVWDRLQVWEARSQTALKALQGIPIATEIQARQGSKGRS